jgi:hypothetical protein
MVAALDGRLALYGHMDQEPGVFAVGSQRFLIDVARLLAEPGFGDPKALRSHLTAGICVLDSG